MSSPDSRPLVEKWRVPALLTAMVLFLVVGGWWSTEQLFGDKPEGSTSCVATPLENHTLHTDQVQVNVSNGGTRTGQARRVSGALSELGFRVGRVSNAAPTDRTLIIGTSVDAPEVRLVRGSVKSADVRADGRADHSVTLVIGKDFDRINTRASRELAVEADELCLPPRARQD